MPLNIPMPQLPFANLNQSIATGGNLFQQMMQPVVEREKLKQLEGHFQEQLKLSKAAAGRAAQAAMDAHKLALMKMDPLHEARQMDAVMDYFRNKNKGAGQAFGVPGAGAQVPQESVPTEEAGQGLGMFSPEGLGQAQQNAIQEQPQTQINQPNLPGNPSHEDLDLFRKFPALRGWYKQHYKIDPLAEQKSSTYTGAARESLDMSRLKKEFGENSEEYRNAQAIQHEKQQQHSDLSAIRNRQLNGLKPGDIEIKDPTSGETIGFSKQLDAKERESAKNAVLFNHLYPLVYSVSGQLTGPGATKRLYDAARTYKTNPQSKKLIDDFLVSEKATANSAVTEAARFGAGRTNQTFNRYVETLKSEDLNSKLKKWIKEFGIPGEASLNAAKRWQKELNAAEKKANSKIPARRSYYFDPEKQFQHEQQQVIDNNNETEPEETQTLNGKTYKKINGEWHELL